MGRVAWWATFFRPSASPIVFGFTTRIPRACALSCLTSISHSFAGMNTMRVFLHNLLWEQDSLARALGPAHAC